LRTNSRKRTHSDSDNNADHTNQELTSEASSEVISENNLVVKKELENAPIDHTLRKKEQTPCASLINEIKEHETKDMKENYLNGQASQIVSPLKKRQRIKDPLQSTSCNNQEKVYAKPNQTKTSPGKENHMLNHGSSEEVQQMDGDINCTQTLRTTSSQCVTAKYKHEVSAQTKPKNWLTEWSAHCRAKYGEKSVQLPEKGSESNTIETLHTLNEVTGEDPPAVDLQHINTQVRKFSFLQFWWIKMLLETRPYSL